MQRTFRRNWLENVVNPAGRLRFTNCVHCAEDHVQVSSRPLRIGEKKNSSTPQNPHFTQQIERKSSEIRLPQTPISGMYQCDIRVVIKKHHFGSRVAPDASRRVFAGRGICPFVSWSRIVLHHLRKGNAKLNIQHTPGNFRTVSL